MNPYREAFDLDEEPLPAIPLTWGAYVADAVMLGAALVVALLLAVANFLVDASEALP